MIVPVSMALAKQSKPLVAYSCRFYYPPSDKRTSFHQIYVSDLHGHHRKQITFDASEKVRVQWVGKDRLAWIESDGASKQETEYGYHFPEERYGERKIKEKLVLYNLKSGHRFVVAEGYIKFEGDYKGPTRVQSGAAFYVQYHETKDRLDVGDKFICLKSSGIEVKPYKNDDHQPQLMGDQWSKVHLDCPPKPSTKMFWYGGKDGTGGDGTTQIITKFGNSSFVPVDVDRVWESSDKKKCWFQVGSYAGSGGCEQYLYFIDWKKGTTTLVANGVLDIDFHPEQSYWAASSNNKGTSQLGKLRVWSRQLWCGTTKEANQWKISNETMHADSAVIQPIR